jgi:beta-phosphoglucomutase-like phosphatase (HAD superfamily)
MESPSPTSSLYAADQIGVSSERCAVVEDSISGVTAGLAAGMTFLAFAGGVISASTLSICEAVLFDDMRTLPRLLLPQ